MHFTKEIELWAAPVKTVDEPFNLAAPIEIQISVS
jgi:hypothetical protein